MFHAFTLKQVALLSKRGSVYPLLLLGLGLGNALPPTHKQEFQGQDKVSHLDLCSCPCKDDKLLPYVSWVTLSFPSVK